jgi:hypothetical protein
MPPYRDDLKAVHILKLNVRSLLLARKESESLLAQHLGYKDRSGLNKFLNDQTREGFEMWRLDKLASFFGLPVYQLFQPGISALTERRVSGERRNPRERRQGHSHRQMIGLASNIDAHRSPGKGRLHVAAASPLVEELRRLTEEHERKVSALISRAESRGQTAGTRPSESKARKGRRNAGGSDAPPPKER